ncbi:MAG TPA: hypothetical protein HA250_03295 [Nanoarchaeota archaeon]|nr:hypothetical protein [Candidatus Pacearchaeota archaeon]HIH51357.1 hypothetical protein [Nanoarchaeota archaeon]
MNTGKLSLFLLLAASLILAGAGCGKDGSGPGAGSSGSGARGSEQGAQGPGFGAGSAGQTPMGFSLSPKSFQAGDFQEFFAKADESGADIITWAGDWAELGKENSAPFVVTELAPQNGFTPILLLQFFEQKNGEVIRPLDAETKAIYKALALDYVEKYHPDYIGLGLESNIFYEKSPREFENFASFYNELYAGIKEVSPRTKVFTVFQLEKMKGLHGGLFGGTNDASKAEWFLMDKFSTDLAVFTTYPSIIYGDPSAIPADYYTELRKHTSKMIAFVEIGWPSDSLIPGFESDEAEQVAFVKGFFTLSRDTDTGPEFLIWSFLYDQDVQVPFNSAGLIKRDGNPKEAYDVWTKEAKQG